MFTQTFPPRYDSTSKKKNTNQEPPNNLLKNQPKASKLLHLRHSSCFDPRSGGTELTGRSTIQSHDLHQETHLLGAPGAMTWGTDMGIPGILSDDSASFNHELPLVEYPQEFVIHLNPTQYELCTIPCTLPPKKEHTLQ
jgi:hypothetical protein